MSNIIWVISYKTYYIGHVAETNGSQLKNPDISGALYTLRIQYSYTVYGILKLNVKMAPEMSEFFNWLPLSLLL